MDENIFPYFIYTPKSWTCCQTSDCSMQQLSMPELFTYIAVNDILNVSLAYGQKKASVAVNGAN